MRRLICSLLLAAAAASPNGAIQASQPKAPQEAGLPSDPQNAALVYYRAWIMATPEAMQTVSDEHKSDADWRPSDKLTAVLNDSQGIVATLLRGSRLPSADFGITYSDGFSALLPHLAKMRASARLLSADSRRAFVAGDVDGAADRVAALYGMASHLTGERLLISPLVAIAIHSLACSQTEFLINSGKLTAQGRQTLLDAMSRLQGDDPFGVRSGIMGERGFLRTWLATEAAKPNAGKMLAALLDGQQGQSPAARQIAAMSDQQLQQQATGIERAYDQIVAAWSAPDPQKELDAIQSAATEGKYGVLAQVTLPALGKAYASHAKALQAHAKTLQALRAYQPPAP